jgi:hypothetical protein
VENYRGASSTIAPLDPNRPIREADLSDPKRTSAI